MSAELTELLAMPAGPIAVRHPAMLAGEQGVASGHSGTSNLGKATLSATTRSEVARLAELSGLPLIALENGSPFAVASGDGGELEWLPADVQTAAERLPRGTVAAIPSGSGVQAAAVALRSDAAAVCILPETDGQPVPMEATIAAAHAGWSTGRLDRWWAARRPQRDDVLVRLLTLARTAAASDDEKAQFEWELESLADQIDSTYEEITLLHYLAQNLQQAHDTTELARNCLDRIGDSLHALGGAAWLQVGEGNSHFLVQGEVPFDEYGLARLIGSFGGHNWPQPLVLNHIQAKCPTEAMRDLDNIVVVPIHSGPEHVGWLTCVNGRDGREFGTVEASLLASIAVTLGTHTQNAKAVREREEMLLSFVRSLVSSLDAKDPYTRGHSERVAAIAAALARQLGDSEEDVQAIHLCGLLHDVGKIGIDDAVLCKPGHLTDDEFEQIKRHPAIGYHILSGIRSLTHILPGVRNHHESWDGTGYPDRLAGGEIPRQARILAVADSYDAMTSDRPYRNGMPLEKLQSIFRAERGKQWDPEVIDAYFAIADEVVDLCEQWKREQ